VTKGASNFRVGESLRARLLSCTGMPRVLGLWRRNSPVMRSKGKTSHRWRVGVTRVIRSGWWSSGPDIGESWGKTTAQPRRLATREESPNGRVERWLGGGKGAAAPYLSVRKSCEKGRKLWPAVAFIPRRRERRGCGPARRRSDVSVKLDRRSQACVRFPLLGVTDGWASVGI
jgi:hypothetical protein